MPNYRLTLYYSDDTIKICLGSVNLNRQVKQRSTTEIFMEFSVSPHTEKQMYRASSRTPFKTAVAGAAGLNLP